MSTGGGNNLIESIENLVRPILTVIGTFVVAGGGLAAIVYAFFRLLSEKWLTEKFEERLAAYKHAQQRELEHLRFEIDALMDRTVKLHQREFDVLPQVWSLFNDAYWQISSFMGFKSYPDVNRMSDVQLEELLRNSSMAQWQKDELKQKSDRTTYYVDYASWKEVVEARKVYGEWQVYFLKNAIFLPELIKDKFSAFSDLLRGALIEYQARQEEKDLKLSECKDLMRLTKEGGKLRDELEMEVHKRLWISTKSADLGNHAST